MTNLKIQIAEADGKEIFTECRPSEPIELIGLGIVEKGTANGLTQVTLFLKQGDKYLHAVTTARLFVTAAMAVRGAQERFGDPEL